MAISALKCSANKERIEQDMHTHNSTGHSRTKKETKRHETSRKAEHTVGQERLERSRNYG